MSINFADKEVHGDLPFNCEVDIDWQTRDVKFTYPQQGLEQLTAQELQHKKDMAYFAHAFAQVFGVLFAFINWILVLKFTDSFLSINGIAFTAVYYHLYKSYMLMLPFTVFMTYGILVINVLGFLTLFGWLSVLLHRNNAWLRREFPNTNALLRRLVHRRTTIDLSKPFGKNWIRRGHEIIIPNVSAVIVSLEIPESMDEKIRRIYTICTAPKPTILTGKFWMIIELRSAYEKEGLIEVNY
jgi:hypothetical protein